MKAFLFSGVHGVGKGFFLEKVKNSLSAYNMNSASTLIDRYQASTDAGYKRVRNVNGNQVVLIHAMKEAMTNDIRDFILDGHLCIFNAEGEVERVPKLFFEETKIAGIILLQDAPEDIYFRIRERDANTIDVCDIERMQREEEKYAKELKRELNIKYVAITHECTEEQFIEVLKNLGGGYGE